MSGEKTLAPTEKRRREAAQKGDVLRSREAATAIAVLAGAAWLKFAGPWLFERLTGALRSGLSWDRAALEQFEPGAAALRVESWALRLERRRLSVAGRDQAIAQGAALPDV